MGTPHHLPAAVEDDWAVQRRRWFTQGFYAVKTVGKDIVIAGLRMGFEPVHVFQFKVAKLSNPHTLPIPNQRCKVAMRRQNLLGVWHRIWQPDMPKT